MRSPIFTRVARAVGLALIGSAFFVWQTTRTAAQAPPACGIDLKVLVLSADGLEADLPAIRNALDYVGTPYDVHIATDHPEGIDPEMLSEGCHSNYQGVILTTDNLAYRTSGGAFATALSEADATALRTFETSFGVRQVTWYTFPTPALGFNYPSGASGDPRTATLTPRGGQIFPYLTPDVSIPIQFSWTYLATPFDVSTAPLLVDAGGHALAAIQVDSDGRENLAMTFDSNPYLQHSMLLSYGVIRWVTKGLFVGDRHTYVSPQIDDLFIDDAQWLASTPCGTGVDLTGVHQRITGVDFTAVANWQAARRTQPLTADVRVTMAFNGYGTTPDFTLVIGQNDRIIGGSTTPGTLDTLTAAARDQQQHFWWVSHTFDHENLDAIGYSAAAAEIVQNNSVAATLGLTNYLPRALVQPDVSGLGNPNVLQAAFDNGVRYMLSDTSKPGQDNPSPNVGMWSPLQPGMFIIPRRANNLFFNVATPADWVAEYNCLYTSFWGRNLSYEEILDKESDQLVAHMLRGELDPWMFHQTNLAAYDGSRTLLGDLLDATFAKYGSLVNLPVLSPSMETLGERMAARTAMRTSGVSATLEPGVGLVLTSPVDVTVPVTGLQLPGAEQYGGDWISWIALEANVPTVAEYSVVEEPLADAGASQTVPSDAAVVLHGSATDHNVPSRALTYAWMQIGGPQVSLAGADTLTPSFTAPSVPPGGPSITLEFALIVDNGSVSGVANTSVVVNPQFTAPTGDAGSPQTVSSGAAVQLSAFAADTNSPPLPLTYSWTQLEGPLVSLSDPTALNPGFTAPTLTVGTPSTTLRFQFVASNGFLDSDPAETSVVVEPPIGAPAAISDPQQDVESGSVVTLTGTGIDPNAPVRPLTYSWTQTSGTPVALADADTPVATFTAPTLASSDAPLTFTFLLTVSNGVLSATAETAILVRPPVPVLAPTQTVSADGPGAQSTPPFAVDAGNLIVAFVSSHGPAGSPQSVTVSGGGLTWTNVQRANTQQGTAEIWTASADAPAPDVVITAEQAIPVDPDLVPYYLSLTVLTFNDARGTGAAGQNGASGGSASVSLTPMASGSLVYAIGNDAILSSTRIVPPGQVVLHDALGPAGDSHWLQGFAAGPIADAGVPVVLSEDSGGGEPWNFAAIEIVNRGAPLVDAGGPQNAESGATVTLAGTASDGSVPPRPLSYDWSQISGPAVFLNDDTTLTPSFAAPVLPVGSLPVTLSFLLTVSDGVLSAIDTTSIELAPPIGAPAVNAGPPQIVPFDSAVTLAGGATDPNLPPLPLAYRWVQTSGPEVLLSDSDTPTATFTAPSLTVGMPAATLEFSLTAFNGMLSSSATTTVQVDPPIGPPTASAALAQDVAGGSIVPLSVLANDPNVPARPLTFSWIQTGGPAVTLIDPGSASAAFVAPSLTIGEPPQTLDFTVTVDNGIYSAASSTTVTVQPPVALSASQSVSSDGSGTRTTAPFAANPGDLIVAFVSAQGRSTGQQTATVTGNGLTWTLARRVNSQRGTSEIWWAWASAAIPSATVTATLAVSANPASLTVMTFAGAGGIGTTAGASGSSGAPTVSITTTQPRSLAFGIGNDATAAIGRTPLNGQQVIHEYFGSASTHWLQTSTGAIANAGSAVQLRDTAPTGDRWNFAAVEILASRPVAISTIRAAATNTAAVITWTTNVPTTSRVTYGSAADALTLSAGDEALVTSHAVTLYGLSAGETYHYRVTSVDAAWTASTSPAPPAAPLNFVATNPAGLVAAYGFNEGAGEVLLDRTGTGNNGEIAGATWVEGGRFGKALSFDGISNWVTVADSSSLDLTTGLTVEAWVNPASLTGWQSVLYKERPDPADSPGLAWALYSTDYNAPPAIYGMLSAPGADPWAHATGNAMLPLNTWSHVAATFDGSSLRLYVNGSLVRTLSMPGQLLATSGALRIGGNSPSIPYGGQFFKGLIDEIRVYNRALSTAEIQSDLATRLP